MNEPECTENTEGKDKAPAKRRHAVQFIASAAVFCGIRFLFYREWITERYLGTPLSVTAVLCMYSMLDGLVSWDAARNRMTWSRLFHFGLILFLFPYAAVALMILWYLAAFFYDAAVGPVPRLYYILFPTVPSLEAENLLSEMHLTISIAMPLSLLGGIMLAVWICRRLASRKRK